MTDFSKLPDVVTWKWLQEHYDHCLGEGYEWEDMTKSGQKALIDLADLIESDRAERAKNTVKIPPKEEWPKEAIGIELWYVEKQNDWDDHAFVSFIPRDEMRDMTPEEMRAALEKAGLPTKVRVE